MGVPFWAIVNTKRRGMELMYKFLRQGSFMNKYRRLKQRDTLPHGVFFNYLQYLCPSPIFCDPKWLQYVILMMKKNMYLVLSFIGIEFYRVFYRHLILTCYRVTQIRNIHAFITSQRWKCWECQDTKNMKVRSLQPIQHAMSDQHFD